jgi:NDP-sugar pyrophosphorylase family protein
MKAILLAGGQGTRLRPLTLHTPKPVAPIFNRPFLEYQIDLVRRLPGISEIVLSLNYQPNRIAEVFGDGSRFGVRLRYVVEPSPLGTGGAIKYAAGETRGEPILVFNGDVFTSTDLAALLRLHEVRRARATIVLTPVDNPAAYGLVETDAEGNIQAFVEKPSADQIRCDTINAGIYVLEADTLDRIPAETVYSIERGYFPSLIARGETFVAQISRGYWIDIGTPEKYRQAHHDIMDGRFAAEPFLNAPGSAQVSPTARVADDVAIATPCFIDDDVTIGRGARIGRYSVIGRGCEIGEGASIDGAILWPGTIVGAQAHVGAIMAGRGCRFGDSCVISSNALLGDGSIVTEYSIMGDR